MSKKIIAMIPARMQASRFPGKLTQILGDKPIIVRTFEAVKSSKVFDEVYVVCDHHDIRDVIVAAGGTVIMSKYEHESGSDRIAEAVADIDCDIVVNIQGDEPFIAKSSLEKLIKLFDHDETEIASLMQRITDPTRITDPNCVKVVCDAQGKALYFSRSAIPYCRDEAACVPYFQHVGVYGFKKETLLKLTQLPPSRLEKTEKLENLRMLENGMKVFLAEISDTGIAIDTPEDLERAKNYLAAQSTESPNAG